MITHWGRVMLALSATGLPLATGAAQLPPVPENPQQAQTSLGFSINTRCPDLRIVEGGPRAVVVLWVPRRGIQSQVSIKHSSGSGELDSAALSCVGRLRFAPAVTLGDGESIDSWQQISLDWVDPGKAEAARAMGAQGAPPQPARPSPPVAMLPAQVPLNATRAEPVGPGSSVSVHVCVDDHGKLDHQPTVVQSSGVDALDQAALKIAAARSAYYRPTSAASRPLTNGCVQLVVRFDTP